MTHISELPKANVEAPLEAGLILGQWNVLLPVANNHTTGDIISTSIQPVDPSVNQVGLRMDVPMTGVPHPFNNPALEVRVDAWASWDGGTTMWQIYSQGGNGSANGLWGKGNPYPAWGLDTPIASGIPGVADGVRATHYRADFTVVAGPISVGLSLLPS